MPPKKNEKGTGDKSPKKESSEQKNDEELTESDKNFYRAQIRELEERLERYQQKCDELEVREKDLHSKISNVEKEKKDIVLYLKRTLAQKEDELIDLAETLSRHQQAQENERESFELQLSLLRHELQENKEKFTSENMALAGKLASLEEFSMQREKIMAERRSLEEQLQKQKEHHQTQIYNLEKKAVLDNDRLKKEMLQHVAVAEKCAKLKVEHQELIDSHSAICTELDALRKKHATVIEVLNQTKAEVKRQRKEFEEERTLRKQLKTVLEEAAVALKEALREVPKEDDTELKITVRRNQMMQKLLAVLDRAAALGNGPALTEFLPEVTCSHDLNKPSDIKRPGELLQKSTSHLSHFKTGDLGLVPSKTNATSKIENLSRSAYTYAHKKQSSDK
ncbi:cilia- and flagella-associated protein 157 [Garra rufa]|uniref:cilia- and flagella-associated protein 157 n=1 Tax=Garra rufa TaxID=137080 RepID=UPI003CCED30F